MYAFIASFPTKGHPENGYSQLVNLPLPYHTHQKYPAVPLIRRAGWFLMWMWHTHTHTWKPTRRFVGNPTFRKNGIIEFSFKLAIQTCRISCLKKWVKWRFGPKKKTHNNTSIGGTGAWLKALGYSNKNRNLAGKWEQKLQGGPLPIFSPCLWIFHLQNLPAMKGPWCNVDKVGPKTIVITGVKSLLYRAITPITQLIYKAVNRG